MALAAQNLAALANLEEAGAQKVNRLRTDPTVDGKHAPWIEKYRPKQLDDVAAHKGIIDTSGFSHLLVCICLVFELHPDVNIALAFAVKRLTSENRLPHLLFYGPPGTGKTSTILAVARQIYGASMQASGHVQLACFSTQHTQHAASMTVFLLAFALQNMTLELNASDERGIAVVRQEIQDFASTKSIFR
jgi:replication factor C subunit 3/5